MQQVEGRGPGCALYADPDRLRQIYSISAQDAQHARPPDLEQDLKSEVT